MVNNIQEPHCSFEVSKLLKEKGFDIRCHKHLVIRTGGVGKKGDIFIHDTLDYDDIYLEYHHRDLPTHALAIEWIRINFNFNIHLYHISESDTWGADVYKLGKGVDDDSLMYSPIIDNITLYNSPQEVIEAALLHTLKILIK